MDVVTMAEIAASLSTRAGGVRSRAHAAACHSRALKISPAISHQPTHAKVRPKLRATAISAIR